MRQPLTDSELREKLKEMFSLPSGQDGQMQSVITNQTIKKLIYLIKQDRQAYVAQQRQELMEEPVKLLEDALQKFSELWKMWAIDYGIDSNMEKIENYLNKLSNEPGGSDESN